MSSAGDAGGDDDHDDIRDNDHGGLKHDDARLQALAAGGWGWSLSPRQIVDLWNDGGYRTHSMIANYLATQAEDQEQTIAGWLWPGHDSLRRDVETRAIYPGNPGWPDRD